MTSTTNSLAVGPMAARQTLVITGSKTPSSLESQLTGIFFGSGLANDDRTSRRIISRSDFDKRFKPLANNDYLTGGDA